MLKKLLLGLPLALLLSVPALASPAGPGSGPTHGPASGSWNLPSPNGAGHMRGLLQTRGGRDVFRVTAKVERDASGKPGGTLTGILEVVSGPNKGAKLRLEGHWTPTSRGEGKFKGKAVGRKTSGGKRAVVGISGKFHDTDPAAAGRFKGRWVRP